MSSEKQSGGDLRREMRCYASFSSTKTMAMINNIASSRLSGHTSWKLQMLDSSSCSDNNNNDDDDEPVVCFGLLFFSDCVAALVNKSINSAQLAILTCSTKGNGLREFLATGNWFRN